MLLSFDGMGEKDVSLSGLEKICGDFLHRKDDGASGEIFLNL